MKNQVPICRKLYTPLRYRSGNTRPDRYYFLWNTYLQQKHKNKELVWLVIAENTTLYRNSRTDQYWQGIGSESRPDVIISVLVYSIALVLAYNLMKSLTIYMMNWRINPPCMKRLGEPPRVSPR